MKTAKQNIKVELTPKEFRWLSELIYEDQHSVVFDDHKHIQFVKGLLPKFRLAEHLKDWLEREESSDADSLLNPNHDFNGYSRSDVAKTMFNTLSEIALILDAFGLPQDDVGQAIHKLQGKELKQWFEQQRDDAFYKPSVTQRPRTTSRPSTKAEN
jgi:hypothetical protein